MLNFNELVKEKLLCPSSFATRFAPEGGPEVTPF